MTSITMDKKETLIFNKVEVEGFSSKEQVVEKCVERCIMIKMALALQI